MTGQGNGEPRVLGVDACSKGWVACCNRGLWYFAESIAGLVSQAQSDGDLEVIGIDMPIGLPDSSERQADLLVRAELGKRRSSIFMTPVRPAITATIHAEASDINRALTGKGLSRQSFNLSKKILEVDKWISSAPARVVEVHPEFSFAKMNGAPLRFRKSNWAGFHERRSLLAEQGINVPGDIGPAGVTGLDDVLDAAAASWSAARVSQGLGLPYPNPPEKFSDGLEAAIWA